MEQNGSFALRKPALDMGNDSINKLLLNMSLPPTLAMAVMASYNIVDTFFVSRLGSEAIAALSVCFPIQMILNAAAAGTGIGGASLISRSLGAQKAEEAATAFGQVILLSLVLGLIVTLIGLFALRPLLLMFGATEAILEQTAEYMSVIANGVVLIFLMMVLSHAIRSEGNAILPMTVMIISAVANVILDPIFIFTFGLGIRGAAIATVLANIIGALLLLRYYVTRKSTLKILFKHLLPNWGFILDIYRVGLPQMLIDLSTNLALIFVNRFLGGFGHIPIAVLGLMQRIRVFSYMPVIGISQGLLPIIGFNFGATKYQRMREAMVKGTLIGTILATLAALILFIFPGFFLRLFSSEEALIDMGIYALRVMVLMSPVHSTQFNAISFFQGIGKGGIPLIVSTLRQFILYVPSAYLLTHFFALKGTWFAIPLADLLAFLVTIVFISREFNRRGIPLFGHKERKPETSEVLN
jgi:putative MATE family efflux protein